MKKFKVTATEEIWYEKIVEAENEDEAYKVFAETLDNDDIVEGRGFEVDEIMLLKYILRGVLLLLEYFTWLFGFYEWQHFKCLILLGLFFRLGFTWFFRGL